MILIALTIIIITYIFILKIRIVVSNLEAHVVQKGEKNIVYGKGLDKGYVYLNWPNWVPIIGINVIKVDLRIFDMTLTGCKALDCHGNPFKIEVTIFYYIKNPLLFIKKTSNIIELKLELDKTFKFIIKPILASKDIIYIMDSDSKKTIEDEFYKEFYEVIKAWGVDLKGVNLMDITDDEGYTVVENIWEKRRSEIEKKDKINESKKLDLVIKTELPEINSKVEK